MSPPNFKLENKGPVSARFLEQGITDFGESMAFVRNLPYGRNADKLNLITVFDEGRGTCSTKHALLKQLAAEHQFEGLSLILGLIRMSRANTPAVAKTLETHKLDYIPEAHNYLRYNGTIIDCMKTGWGPEHFSGDILQEVELSVDQITDHKVKYHRNFLNKWLEQNKHIPYQLDELWAIREQCIQDLSA